jgi:hypothetical protein
MEVVIITLAPAPPPPPNLPHASTFEQVILLHPPRPPHPNMLARLDQNGNADCQNTFLLTTGSLIFLSLTCLNRPYKRSLSGSCMGKHSGWRRAAVIMLPSDPQHLRPLSPTPFTTGVCVISWSRNWPHCPRLRPLLLTDTE